jgi:uncharacterized protein YjbI with pentapeptide repeats
MLRIAANALTFAFFYALAATAHAANTADANAVASIKAGHHDCAHCELAGADFSGAKLVLMCMSYADFKGASFRHTDLAGANLAHAKLDGADFTGASLSITSFKGTDLRRAKGLTQKQLDAACGDADTKAPQGLSVKTCS